MWIKNINEYIILHEYIAINQLHYVILNVIWTLKLLFFFHCVNLRKHYTCILHYIFEVVILMMEKKNEAIMFITQ